MKTNPDIKKTMRKIKIHIDKLEHLAACACGFESELAKVCSQREKLLSVIKHELEKRINN